MIYQSTNDLNLDLNLLSELLKPLFVLSDSGIYWRRTLRRFLEKYIGMISCILYAVLDFKTIRKHLVKACGPYVDDTLHTGNEEFCRVHLKNLNRSSNLNRSRPIACRL